MVATSQWPSIKVNTGNSVPTQSPHKIKNLGSGLEIIKFKKSLILPFVFLLSLRGSYFHAFLYSHESYKLSKNKMKQTNKIK